MRAIENNDSAILEDIIVNHKKSWNKLIIESQKANKKIQLSGLTLRNQDLKGINLSNTEIEDSDFSDSDLSDADLSNANISRTNFISAKLQRSNLYSTRITQTNMSGARLYNARLKNVNMTGSVNLFNTYLHPHEEEHQKIYKTTAQKTVSDFRMKEHYEHLAEHGPDDEDNNPYY